MKIIVLDFPALCEELCEVLKGCWVGPVALAESFEYALDRQFRKVEVKKFSEKKF